MWSGASWNPTRAWPPTRTVCQSSSASTVPPRSPAQKALSAPRSAASKTRICRRMFTPPSCPTPPTTPAASVRQGQDGDAVAAEDELVTAHPLTADRAAGRRLIDDPGRGPAGAGDPDADVLVGLVDDQHLAGTGTGDPEDEAGLRGGGGCRYEAAAGRQLVEQQFEDAVARVGKAGVPVEHAHRRVLPGRTDELALADHIDALQGQPREHVRVDR